MVHKPKHKVHSFKGLLADGGQDEINLERQNANVAYRIVKLQAITTAPGATTAEAVIKVYRENQSSVDGVVDFNDADLLGMVYWTGRSTTVGTQDTIIFDSILFSRNIYVTAKDVDGGRDTNYYLEIEEVPVSASALIQLKLGTARRNIGGKIGPTPG